jgi:hypothetical protein
MPPTQIVLKEASPTRFGSDRRWSARFSCLSFFQVVGTSSIESRPLGDWPSARLLGFPSRCAAFGSRICALLRPAGGRVFPLLLASIHCEIHKRVTVIHRLRTPAFRPVGFEHAVTLSQIANQVEQANLAADEEGAKRRKCRVPRYMPTHKVAVPAAFVVRSLAEDRVSNVARMKVCARVAGAESSISLR